MKKKLSKAEYERKRAIKIAEKSKPNTHYNGVELEIKGRDYYEHCPDYSDPLLYAMGIHMAMLAKQAQRHNKMWGPVTRKFP